jgi:hypothetical protein
VWVLISIFPPQVPVQPFGFVLWRVS